MTDYIPDANAVDAAAEIYRQQEYLKKTDFERSKMKPWLAMRETERRYWRGRVARMLQAAGPIIAANAWADGIDVVLDSAASAGMNVSPLVPEINPFMEHIGKPIAL